MQQEKVLEKPYKNKTKWLSRESQDTILFSQRKKSKYLSASVTDDGYYFNSWDGDVAASDKEKTEITITMDGDKEITPSSLPYVLTGVTMTPGEVNTHEVMYSVLKLKATPQWQNGKYPANGVTYKFYYYNTPVEFLNKTGASLEWEIEEVDEVKSTYVDVEYDGVTQTSSLLIWK